MVEQNKEMKALFKKKKILFAKYYHTEDFKEPVLMLIKRNSKVKVYENVKQAEFEFEHSDGEMRKILLNQKFLLTFPYGQKVFRGYICHEDHGTPLPDDPLIMAESFSLAIDKTVHDVKEWRAKEIKAKGEMWWKIIIGIAILGGVYIAYKLIVPTPPAQQVVEQVVRVVNTTPTFL